MNMVLDQERNIAHQDILKRFSLLIKNDRLAHAYLFIGPEGVGKTQTALGVAKLINCESQTKTSKAISCDTCASCRKINSGNHPDVTVIDSGDGQTIKVEKIRDLIAQSQLSPYEARKKIFIIKDTEHLTQEGGNALLKTLEEPAANSILILTTSVPEKNLETVKSRCHAIQFFPWPPQQLAPHLQSLCKMDYKTAHFLAYFSEGCVGKAQRLFAQGFFQEKNGFIDQFIFHDGDDHFLKEILANRERTKQVLDVLLYWVRDLLLLKRGVSQERIIHQDRAQELTVMESRYSCVQLEEIILEIVQASRLWGDNLNVKIPLALIREKIWGRSSKYN